MKMLLSPNSFKGTCAANDMALYWAENFRQFFLGTGLKTPRLEILPIADGGDDTLTVLQAQEPEAWQVLKQEILGPLAGFTVMATSLFAGNGSRVIIEAAQAHGISILVQRKIPLAALDATSYGVGQLIQKALSVSDREILVTLGGSASTDGGLGALQALGTVFLDNKGDPITDILAPKHFMRVRSVCPSSIQAVRDKLAGITLTILTDVKNPLLGAHGAAFTFAPQKGANSQDCAYLESELARLASLIDEAFGTDSRSVPGAGAAGGLGYGLLQLPGARIQSGFEWLSGHLGLEAKLQLADCVVTGEGRFDQTSCQGKATGEIIALAKRRHKKVILICGAIEEQALRQVSHSDLFSMAMADVVPLQEAMAKPEVAVRKTLKRYGIKLSEFLARPVAGPTR